MAKINSPLKWWGGKSYLAPKLLQYIPEHIHYVEPYFGGGALLLAKPYEGISEVVNDLNLELTDFWRCLSNKSEFNEFFRIVQAIPFSQYEYKAASEDAVRGRVARAVAFFVRCRQSMSGRMDSFAPLSKTRTRRGMNEQAAAWLTAIEGLSAVHERLKRVVVLCDDALKVIKSQDDPETFFYVDPPYVKSTRTAPKVYRHEMSLDQHLELLSILSKIRGKFMLSGYRCSLYDDMASCNGWRRVDFDLPNNAATGKTKRRMVESIWMNY